MKMILKPEMMCLRNAKNYLTNWSLISQKPVLKREMVYRKRKDCVKCRITLGLTKTRMDLIKEAINLARESDQISYMFADINCSLFVKLSNGSFKFFNITDDLNNV